MDAEGRNFFLDSQKEVARSNRTKDKIIILLIVLMFLEAVAGWTGFLLYESQFVEYGVEKVETQEIDMSSSGDSANAEYNDVEGNQYNDSATHNE